MLLIAFASLTIFALFSLVLPLVSRAGMSKGRTIIDAVFHDEQLVELERDLERGVISADQIDGARTEIHRRLLAADPDEPLRLLSRRGNLLLIILICLGVPAASVAIYGRLGAPQLPGLPYSSRQSDPAIRMASLVDQLAARLEVRPEGEGYRRLGDAYALLQRPDDAVEAYRRANNMGVDDGRLFSAWGEALVIANEGAVIPEATRLFLRALSVDAKNQQAKFYLALAEAQNRSVGQTGSGE